MWAVLPLQNPAPKPTTIETDLETNQQFVACGMELRHRIKKAASNNIVQGLCRIGRTKGQPIRTASALVTGLAVFGSASTLRQPVAGT